MQTRAKLFEYAELSNDFKKLDWSFEKIFAFAFVKIVWNPIVKSSLEFAKKSTKYFAGHISREYRIALAKSKQIFDQDVTLL